MLSRRRRSPFVLAVVLAFALFVAGCGDDDDDRSADTTTTAPAATTTSAADGSTSTTGGVSTGAACDESLISDAIDASADGPVVSIDQYACDDGWAYAFATVGGGDEGATSTTVPEISITVLLEAGSGSWAVVDRESPCGGDEVPEAIRGPACDSN